MFYDTLVRTPGLTAGALNDTTSLFTSGGARSEATTNLINGSTLPSDQSHVVLALRVFTWFRNPILRVAGGGVGEVARNGDYGTLAPWLVGGVGIGQAPGMVQDVYRLHFQAEEQLHWSFGTGLKNSIDNMPTWYFPAGGGISGDNGGTTDLIHWQNSGYDGHAGILEWGTSGASCLVNLGEFKEAPAPLERAECDVTLSQAEQRTGASRVARKVQRLEHRQSKPLTLTSAQLCGNADDEIVHATCERRGRVMQTRARNPDPAEAEYPLPGEDVCAARRWSRWRFRNDSRQPQHAVAARQPERHRRGAEGHHLHVRRSEQAVIKPTSNGETCNVQAIPCRAPAKAGEGRRDLCAALPRDGEREARSGAGGRTQPAKRWARRRAVVTAHASGVMG